MDPEIEGKKKTLAEQRIEMTPTGNEDDDDDLVYEPDSETEILEDSQ